MNVSLLADFRHKTPPQFQFRTRWRLPHFTLAAAAALQLSLCQQKLLRSAPIRCRPHVVNGGGTSRLGSEGSKLKNEEGEALLCVSCSIQHPCDETCAMRLLMAALTASHLSSATAPATMMSPYRGHQGPRHYHPLAASPLNSAHITPSTEGRCRPSLRQVARVPMRCCALGKSHFTNFPMVWFCCWTWNHTQALHPSLTHICATADPSSV